MEAGRYSTFLGRSQILSTYTFPLFVLLRQVLSRVMLLTRLSLVVVAPCWPQKMWFAGLLSLLVEKPLELPLLWNLLVQPHIRKFHRGLGSLPSHVGTIKHLVRRAGFSREIAEVFTSDLGFHSSTLSEKVVRISPLML